MGLMPGGGAAHHHHHPSHSGRINDDSSLTSQLSLPSVPTLTTSHPPHYLPYNSFVSLITTLKGHTSYLCSLTVAGDFLYSGSSDQEIRSWTRHHHHRSDELLEHDDEDNNNVVAEGKGAVKSMVVSEDKLFSAHQDHKIRVWKIIPDHHHHHSHHHNQQQQQHPKFQRLGTLPTLTDRASKMLSPGNQVQIRRHKSSSWVHHVDAVAALALSHDESLLYSVSWDRTLKIWRTSDFKCLESVTNAHDDAINAVAVSFDGTVYTGSADQRIKAWRRDDSAGQGRKHLLAETLEKHNSGINALALSQDGSVLYSGACDRSILVWEKKDGDDGGGEMVVVGALRGHTESILCLFVVCDLVCSGSADKTVRVWRAGGVDRDYSCLAVLEGHAGPVKCLTAAVDSFDDESASCCVYSGGLDCDIKVWQISVPVL